MGVPAYIESIENLLPELLIEKVYKLQTGGVLDLYKFLLSNDLSYMKLDRSGIAETWSGHIDYVQYVGTYKEGRLVCGIRRSENKYTCTELFDSNGKFKLYNSFLRYRS